MLCGESQLPTVVKMHKSVPDRHFANILPDKQPSFLVLLADLTADLGNQPGTETHKRQPDGLVKGTTPEKPAGAWRLEQTWASYSRLRL